jgi:hypothetical protein
VALWTEAALLFAPASRQHAQGGPFSLLRHGFADVAAGAKGLSPMQRVSSLLRSAPARVRRQLKLIVEIAAASLPDVGA